MTLPPHRRSRRDFPRLQTDSAADAGISAVYLVIMTVMLVVGISSTGALRWAAVAVVVIVAVALLTRSGATRAGLAVAMLAALTAPWNAVAFGGLRPGDLALAGAVLLLLCSRRSVESVPSLLVPGWLLLLVGAVATLTAAHQLLPTSPVYLAQRVIVDAGGASAVTGLTNIGIGGRWLVSLVGVPLLCVLVRQHGEHVLRRFALAYVVGAAVSGLVAVSDSLGATAISARFIIADSGGRQAGLTVHPNHLAASACLAVPFAIWALSRGNRRLTIAMGLALLGLLAAVYESGSRGGAVCVVLAATLTLVLIRRLRSRLPFVVGAAFAAMFVVFGLFPDVLAQLLTSVRLSNGGAGVDVSDQVRATLGAQGTADFEHSPFVGIGMQVGLDAHMIYKQLLAAGGIVLFACFVGFVLGMFRDAIRIGPEHTLALAAAASIAAWLLFGMVENLLTDRFLYVPVGIVVALVQRPVADHLARRSRTAVGAGVPA